MAEIAALVFVWRLDIKCVFNLAARIARFEGGVDLGVRQRGIQSRGYRHGAAI